MTEIYEERVVAYIDILGWKAATNAADPRLKQALQIIHDEAEGFGRQEKERTKQIPGVIVNPMYLAVQVAAFSDNIAISMPAGFGERIFSFSGDIARRLLSLGFLVRGGVTVGLLYQEDNFVFGPALNEAVELEKDACLPRILCSEKIMERAKGWQKDDRTKSVTKDMMGRDVVNLFPQKFTTTPPAPPVMDSLEEMWGISSIREIIDKEIRRFAGAGDGKLAEKWRYMRSLMDSQLALIIN